MPHASRRLAAALFVASLAAAACTTTASPSASAPGPSATSVASEAPASATEIPTAIESATPVPGPIACTAAGLAARITLWDAAAGQRYATVQLTNKGAAPCDLPSAATPQLVDGGGNVLIAGTETPTGTLSLGAGGVVSTTIGVGNYCGPAATAPISIAFVFGAGAMRIVAAPLSPTDASGLPPCNGDPGSAGSLDMKPWAP